MKIQLRNDTAANWTSANTILAQGEIGIENDTKKYKIGDGSTAWNALEYVGIIPPDTQTDNYVPQWDGANAGKLKDGLQVVTSLSDVDTAIPTSKAVYEEIVSLKSAYSRREKVLSFADNTQTPPSENSGDRYLLTNDGASNAAWDGAAGNSIVEFNGTSWEATTPKEGWIVFVDSTSKDAVFLDDGTPKWETRNVAVTAHSGLTGVGTHTHTQIDSHIDSTANPHSVSKTQVGLSNVTNDAQLKRSANDWTGISSKTIISNNDKFLIEDSADSYVKKVVLLNNIAVHGGNASGN
jgi:hypothetical protein